MPSCIGLDDMFGVPMLLRCKFHSGENIRLSSFVRTWVRSPPKFNVHFTPNVYARSDQGSTLATGEVCRRDIVNTQCALTTRACVTSCGPEQRICMPSLTLLDMALFADLLVRTAKLTSTGRTKELIGCLE